jgi:hypothetical protein
MTLAVLGPTVSVVTGLGPRVMVMLAVTSVVLATTTA